MYVEGMCGLDSTGSENAVSNMVLSSRDWRQMDRGSILSTGYEFVSSPASGKALGPTPDTNKIRTVSGAQSSFQFIGYWGLFGTGVYWVLGFIGYWGLLGTGVYWVLGFIGYWGLLGIGVYWVLGFIGYWGLLGTGVYSRGIKQMRREGDQVEE